MLSKNEMLLLEHFGLNALADRVEPLTLYRMMCEAAFLRAETGPYADALRRGYKVLLAGAGPYRLSEEFEALVAVV